MSKDITYVHRLSHIFYRLQAVVKKIQTLLVEQG